MALQRRSPRPLTLLAVAGVVSLIALARRHTTEVARSAEELARVQAELLRTRNAYEVAASALQHQAAALPLPVTVLGTQTADLFTRSLGGDPETDVPQTQRFLLCLAVGVKQKEAVTKLVSRFDLQHFVIMLFHYDGRVDAWSDLPDAILHVSAKAQSKWWFAKRFAHPDVVGVFELIFIWDEDIGVETFDPMRFAQLVQSNAVTIAQPAIGHGPVSWPITRRVPGSVLRRCNGNGLDASPCIEVMVPVFTAEAWRCVWSLLPNDLVHAFGVDLAWHVCAGDGGTSSMAVVDEQSVEHLGVPSLGEQGPNTTLGHAPWESVDLRRREEWRIWSARWAAAQRLAKEQHGR